MGYPVVFMASRHVFVDENGIEMPDENAEFALKFMRECLSLDTPRRPGVVHLAISTLDKGECARDFILDCWDNNIPVVTCEKGISHHFKQLHGIRAGILEEDVSPVPILKYNASVSGGVQVLEYLKSRHLNMRVANIEGVLNGTCNFIFDYVASGKGTLAEACAMASVLGYADPGSSAPLPLINGELVDVVMKTCIFFNTVLSKGSFLTPDLLGSFQLDANQLEELSGKARSYRLVVSFSNQGKRKLSFFNGHFEAEADGWYIQGGFRDTREDDDLLTWLPGGVKNAVHVVEGELGKGGAYTLLGPGAGAEETTTAMINDMLSLFH